MTSSTPLRRPVGGFVLRLGGRRHATSGDGRGRGREAETRTAVGPVGEPREPTSDPAPSGAGQTGPEATRSVWQERLRGIHLRQLVREQRRHHEAQEAIAETTASVTAHLREVVTQSGAVRDAAGTIQERMTATSAATRSLVGEAQDADEQLRTLAASLQRVDGMTTLIADVAAQTHLLSLNAAIEAARAGAAGRGFAVVADEVKALAATTARSTGQIADTLADLQRETAETTRALSAMIERITAIDAATAGVTTQANAQCASVALLDGSVQEAISQIEQLGDRTSGVVRERRHQRVALTGAVTLTMRGEAVEAELLDLSDGGVGCVVADSVRVAVGDRIVVHLPQISPEPLLTRAVRVTSTRFGAELGLVFVDRSPDLGAVITNFATRLLTVD